MAGSIVGSIAGAATGAVLNKAFGPDDPDIPDRTPLKGFQPLNLSAPGVNFSSTGNGTFDLSRGAGATDALAGLRGAADTRIGDIENLLGLVSPGFGKVTQARVDAIRNTANKSISNLRGNLSRRKVLGSGFGEAAIGSVASQFAQEEGNARAKGFLEELDATTKLLDAQFQADTAAFSSALNQSNFETSAATDLINAASQIFSNNSQILGQIAIANAQGFGAGIAPITKAVSDFDFSKFLPSPTGTTTVGGGGQPLGL